MITVKMSGQQLDESIFDGCDQGHCAGHHITVVLPVSSSASLPVVLLGERRRSRRKQGVQSSGEAILMQPQKTNPSFLNVKSSDPVWYKNVVNDNNSIKFDAVTDKVDLLESSKELEV